jgi:hypothetical protein
MNDNSTNISEYKPTAAEERLLEVMMHPENFGKSITEKCRIAEIDRQTYYNAMKKPEFVELYNSYNKEMIRSTIGEVIQATKNFGIRFPGNHQDRKILLEMAGAYTEKQEVKVTGEMIIDIKLTDED